MATDYTVIITVRQRFGDSPGGTLGDDGRDWDEFPIENNAPFVGASKDFRFTCPNVDRSQAAVLQFNTLAVGADNVIRVNGVDVPGGISLGPQFIDIDPRIPLWTVHSLLVDGDLLQEENVLHIASGDGGFGNLDDFIVDNAVIWFKTRTGASPTTPPARL